MPTGSSGAASDPRGKVAASRPAAPDNISFRRVTMVISQIVCGAGYGERATPAGRFIMDNEKGPNIKNKQKCKNCEGKGLLKKGDRVVKCQRCKGTGMR